MVNSLGVLILAKYHAHSCWSVYNIVLRIMRRYTQYFFQFLPHLCPLFPHAVNHVIHPLVPMRRMDFQVYICTDFLGFCSSSYECIFKNAYHNFIPKSVSGLQSQRLLRVVRSSELSCPVEVLTSF